MYWRGVVLSLAAALLLGCASGRIGADYATMIQKVGSPRAGQARMVLLQEKASGLGYGSCACDMKLDGDPIGRLKPGTYLYADRPAGHHQLLAAETMFPGDSKRDITMESGRTYFFLARVSERHSTYRDDSRRWSGRHARCLSRHFWQRESWTGRLFSLG